MLEILKFIFSSFWVWLGTVILISSVSAATAGGIFRFNIKTTQKPDDSK
jgi:hypothetical protein